MHFLFSSIAYITNTEPVLAMPAGINCPTSPHIVIQPWLHLDLADIGNTCLIVAVKDLFLLVFFFPSGNKLASNITIFFGGGGGGGVDALNERNRI